MVDRYRPRESASIRDVARRANVSAATASRSLRARSNVAPNTRDRVLAAARDLGYSLPRGGDLPPLIGVLARFPNQWYFAEAITALERSLGEGDRWVALHNMGDPAGRRRFFERVLPLGHLDGIAVISTSFDALERRALDRLQIPLVVVGGHLPGYPTVGIDEEEAARTATQHLIGLGHRDIGMLSFEPADPVGDETTTMARAQGFRAALADGGLEANPDWVVVAEGSRMSGGFRAAERLLSQPKLPTAVFAMSDELAIGALRAVRRAGLTVPGHLSLVGFDDHEMAEFVDLTTIHQSVPEQAATVARMLLKATDQRGSEAVTHRVPVRLVVRGTTGPPG